MARRVIWRSAAEADLAEAYLFLVERSPLAAEQLVDAVQNAVGLLLEHPVVGRRREFRSTAARGIRSWALRGYPSHLLFYKVDRERDEIIRLLHAARDLPRFLREDT